MGQQELGRASYDPITEPARAIDWETMRSRFLGSRERCIAAIKNIADDKLGDPVPHPFGGQCSRAELLSLLSAHQMYHAGQLGIVRRDQGRLDEARRDLERALAIGEHALGPSHPDLCFTLVNLGELVCARNDYDEARRLLERAQAIWLAALGPDHPDLGNAVIQLAQVALSQGKLEQARSLADRAVKLGAGRAMDLALDRFVLAQVLWASPADRPRARELALAARDAYAHAGAQRSRIGLEIAAWLTEHELR